LSILSTLQLFYYAKRICLAIIMDGLLILLPLGFAASLAKKGTHNSLFRQIIMRKKMTKRVVFYSHVGNEMFPRWGESIPNLGNK
jgi:hypothetical protein